MKHSRVTPVSFAAVLGPLAGIAASLAGALPARGGEVPFTERVISTTAFSATSVFATDVDGDGDIDVLSASSGDNKIAWYESDGETPPTFTERVILSTANGPNSVFAADLDGDGDTDVLSASTNSPFLRWYENGGRTPPAFDAWLIPTGALGTNSVFATDVDGDGDIDVLSAALFGDNIAWYENNGAPKIPTFTAHAISTDANDARSVFATDVDGDGDIDVLSASFNPFKIAWYESDGETPPVFTEQVISTGTNGDVVVFAADVDGDGDIDVLSGSEGGNKIAWYENDGDSPPSFTERVISTNAINVTSVFATDVDGDGDIDVLSASSSDHKIAWYENGLIEKCNIAADIDNDCDVDLEDFALFQAAFTGPL